MADHRLWHAMAEQLRHPRGAWGVVTGWCMLLANAAPYRLAIDALRVEAGNQVLELGSGPGSGLSRLLRQRRATCVVGVDASRTMIRQAARRNRRAVASGRLLLHCGRFSPLPWADESFDRILLVNAAYFFDQEGRDMAELHRVLRSGGVLAAYVTSQTTMRRWPFASPKTHRLFDGERIREELSRAGFEAREIILEDASLAFGVKGIIATARR